MSTSRSHAHQLARAIGILDAVDGDADVLAEGRAVLERVNDKLPYNVEPVAFDSVGVEEYRSLAVYCHGAHRHLEPADAKVLERLAEWCAERVEAEL